MHQKEGLYGKYGLAAINAAAPTLLLCRTAPWTALHTRDYSRRLADPSAGLLAAATRHQPCHSCCMCALLLLFVRPCTAQWASIQCFG